MPTDVEAALSAPKRPLRADEATGDSSSAEPPPEKQSVLVRLYNKVPGATDSAKINLIVLFLCAAVMFCAGDALWHFSRAAGAPAPWMFWLSIAVFGLGGLCGLLFLVLLCVIKP
eukprot:tig00020908_g15306.t1